MARIQLTAAPILFDEEQHKYFRESDGKELCGVTKMLKYQLAPDHYAGIPQTILNKAASKGSLIHSLCESYDNFGDTGGDYHVEDYALLKQDWNLQYEVSEYIVTDNENFASPIDKVYRVNDTDFILGDIKTVSTMDDTAKLLLMWQLSIYARQFEIQNPGARVVKLLGIWLPDRKYRSSGCIFEVLRVRDELVDKLIAAEFSNGMMYNYSIPRNARGGNVPKDALPAKKDEAMTFDNSPEGIQAIREYVINTIKAKQQADEEMEKMKTALRDAMKANGIKSLKTDLGTFSFKAGASRTSYNMEQLKADNPKLDLSKYMSVTVGKESFEFRKKQ